MEGRGAGEPGAECWKQKKKDFEDRNHLGSDPASAIGWALRLWAAVFSLSSKDNNAEKHSMSARQSSK